MRIWLIPACLQVDLGPTFSTKLWASWSPRLVLGHCRGRLEGNCYIDFRYLFFVLILWLSKIYRNVIIYSLSNTKCLILWTKKLAHSQIGVKRHMCFLTHLACHHAHPIQSLQSLIVGGNVKALTRRVGNNESPFHKILLGLEMLGLQSWSTCNVQPHCLHQVHSDVCC